MLQSYGTPNYGQPKNPDVCIRHFGYVPFMSPHQLGTSFEWRGQDSPFGGVIPYDRT